MILNLLLNRSLNMKIKFILFLSAVCIVLTLSKKTEAMPAGHDCALISASLCYINTWEGTVIYGLHVEVKSDKPDDRR